MKKKINVLIGVAVLLMSLFSFTGCGSSATIKGASDTTEEKTTTEEKKTTEDDLDYDYDTPTKNTYDDDDDEDETTKKTSSEQIHSTWDLCSGDGYTFEISLDWTSSKNANSDVVYSHLGTATDGFTENLNVVIQDTSSYNLDLESYKDLSLEQFDELGYNLEECKHMTVNGVKGYYCETTVKQSGIDCYVAQYFTLIDDVAYVFTFAADEDGYDELIDEVIEIFETIKFEDVSGF